MDLRTAAHICHPHRAPMLETLTAQEVKRLAKRQTDHAALLGFNAAYSDASAALLNLDAFNRGMVELDGARHYARELVHAAARLEAILAQVTP